jgi:hypothetical protein
MADYRFAERAAPAFVFREGCLQHRIFVRLLLNLILRLGKIPMCAKFVIKGLYANET